MAAVFYHKRNEQGKLMVTMPHEQAKTLHYAWKHPETAQNEAVRLRLANIKAIHFSQAKVIEDYGILPTSGLVG